MQWAYRWLHHVKPRLVLGITARSITWTPLNKPRAYCSSSSPSPLVPGNETGLALLPPDAKAGDYRRSYDLVVRALVPPRLDREGNRRPPALPPLDQHGIYQLLQHVKDGMLPMRFATLEWPGSTGFWVDLLKKSLDQDNMMPDVWDFAQWWVREQGVMWPNFYETVLRYYLERGRLTEALKWHMKMRNSHAFRPSRDVFVDIINAFSGDPDREMAILLNNLYSLSEHRDLYDLVIPFLYGRGMLTLAIRWHGNFCHRKDFPQTLASRAFIVFLKAYFPATYKKSLPAEFHETDAEHDGKEVAEESSGVGEEVHTPVDGDEGVAGDGGPSNEAGQEVISSPLGLMDGDTETSKPLPLREQVPRGYTNTVYGQIFGISEKEYNDPLGARWFASTWVSLDTAINIIHGMGIEKIGPLSIQSIAIREAACEGVQRRLDQLRSLGIAVVECNYTTLLKRFARAQSQKHLTMLLKTDMHPDAFEDLNILVKVKLTQEAAGDEDGAQFWKDARDILSERRANHLVQVLSAQSHQKTLHILDDLAASNLTLSRETLDSLVVQMHKTFHVDAKPTNKAFAKFQVDLFMRLLKLSAPLPTKTWTCLLFSLGRNGHLDLLESLTLALTQHMLDAHTHSGPGFMTVCPSDTPLIARAAMGPGQRLLRIPNDLPSRHEWHPLNLIFTSRLQSAIVRWGIWQSLSDPRTRPRPASDPRKSVFLSGGGNPAEFFVARGIRLLRLLKDRGLFIINTHAISKRVVLRLAELYGPEIRFKVPHRVAREVNTLTMEEFVGICNEAWGEKLLPPPEKLQVLVEEYRGKHMRGHAKYIERKGIVVRKQVC